MNFPLEIYTMLVQCWTKRGSKLIMLIRVPMLNVFQYVSNSHAPTLAVIFHRLESTFESNLIKTDASSLSFNFVIRRLSD